MLLCTILILISIHLLTQANGRANLIDNHCTTFANFTDNYKTGLNQLLTTLTSESSSKKFSNITLGSDGNKVNGLYYCRGDLTVADCNDCVKAAATDVVSVCPVAKEAIIWYEECTLRYSNMSIILSVSPWSRHWSNSTVSNPNEFLDALEGLLDQLIDQAASSQNYAEGKTDVTNLQLGLQSGQQKWTRRSLLSLQTIYGLVQCTPDLNNAECKNCLLNARSLIMSASTDAMINLPSCRLMYDIVPFGPSTSPSSHKGSSAKFHRAIAVLITSVAVLVLGIVFCCFLCCRKKKKTMFKGEEEYIIEVATQFDLVTMKSATQDFSPMNKLGQGDSGIVYKGELENGEELAIKRLSDKSEQGFRKIMNEVQLVMKLQHNNLVRLMGFCNEAEERLVVYEFMPKLSLDYYLFDQSKSKHLSWETRYKIIEGIARGLQYLHQDSRYKVVHCDLKASNILLDQDMNPKISDFGIAKHVLLDQTQGHNNTTALVGQFNFKSDVFSFGVILLETVSGQRNSPQYQQEHREGFLVHAWKCWKRGEIEEVMDPTVRKRVGRIEEVGRCIQIGLLCVQFDAESRPSMHNVLLMLNAISMQLPPPSSPLP